ncbi:flagellar brake protein [Caldinitratiruptor microaerophilus]|uniref:Glycosyltransferase-like protein n=1 Tax=Caldinitratiruptor microaerophilus TaxID=671077 RepID=A0AA35G7J1_9FIRM|nr:PilZ domain-containing protein [Caldinitratiruptor microaerophilus]BDG59373.1 glycosyltransferase-like protein [Caldinitratiruptor microaerophilus]
MLRVNAQVELQLLGDEQTRYRTRVEEVAEDRFRVSLPTAHGKPADMVPGDAVRGYLLKGHAMYVFDTRVLQRTGGLIPTLDLALPTHYERVQRRDWVRLDARLPARYARVEPVELDGPQPPPPRKTRTVDISGGGVALYLAEPLDPGTLVDVFIDLPDTQVVATAEVVRIIRSEPEGYLAGLRFVDIRERDRTAIMRYIFQEQRERRRKGLL